MRKSRGFSLAEAIISLLLIVIAGIVILGSFPTVRKGLQLSENRVNAAYLGRSLLDDMRRKGFDSAAALYGVYDYNGSDNGAAFSQQFSYNVYMEQVNATKKRIWAEVSWQDATGGKRVIVESLLCK
jgi:Tfp pilus assembly protein PilV